MVARLCDQHRIFGDVLDQRIDALHHFTILRLPVEVVFPDKPEMLYLDKCWNEFQVLLGPEPGQPARPALHLVDGRVTDVPMGWIAYERARSPAEVKAVAADLTAVDESDIRRMVAELPHWRVDPDQEHEYVAEYLADAKEFTAPLAADGRGLVWMIG